MQNVSVFTRSAARRALTLSVSAMPITTILAPSSELLQALVLSMFVQVGRLVVHESVPELRVFVAQNDVLTV